MKRWPGGTTNGEPRLNALNDAAHTARMKARKGATRAASDAERMKQLRKELEIVHTWACKSGRATPAIQDRILRAVRAVDALAESGAAPRPADATVGEPTFTPREVVDLLAANMVSTAGFGSLHQRAMHIVADAEAARGGLTP